MPRISPYISAGMAGPDIKVWVERATKTAPRQGRYFSTLLQQIHHPPPNVSSGTGAELKQYLEVF